jgi:opacity protein-like surface antigen
MSKHFFNHDDHDGHNTSPTLSSSSSCRRGFQLCLTVLFLAFASHASAQDGLVLRGFGDVGATTFTAEQSFTAILGSRSGAVFGGGVEVVLPQRIFVGLRASRFSKTGERVFVSDGETFGLGIPTTIALTPVQITGGYRLPSVGRLTPYAGAGPGWYGYSETSDFAGEDENVSERFTGFHVLGGAEVQLARWLSLGGELQWATVPDAIGDDANSVAREFSESNLGGTTVRVRFVVGM